MLHEKSEDILRGLYKSAIFVIQAIIFKQTRNYTKHHYEMLNIALPKERMIIEYFLKYRNKEDIDFNVASQYLFEWSKEWIAKA